MKDQYMNIPFSPPFINESVMNEVASSLCSGWITTGPKVKQLELLLKEYTNFPQCVCINSWTSGAQLVLKWWGVGPGDEVIVPAYTYAATALVVLHAGATPVMVDVDEDFVMDPELLRKAITPKTKAIIPVDISGWPCDYERIHKILEEPAIHTLFISSSDRQQQLGRPLVLADAAHSLGAIYNNEPAGLKSDIAVYSLHAVKNVTTAEGGAIGLNLPAPFDNTEIFQWMKLNSLNGQTKDAYSKTQGGSWKYDIISDGLKINMPDICAAIGLAQLRDYEAELLPLRKKIAAYYHSTLQNKYWAVMPPLQSAGRESSYHIFPLRIKGITEIQRDDMIKFIISKGVSVNVHFIPLPMLSLFRNKGYDINDFPVSYRNYSTEISLPVYPQLSKAQLDYILSVVEKAYQTIMQ